MHEHKNTHLLYQTYCFITAQYNRLTFSVVGKIYLLTCSWILQFKLENHKTRGHFKELSSYEDKMHSINAEQILWRLSLIILATMP